MPNTEEIREASYELQQYLSDRLAPLMVAESVGLLLAQPAGVLAGEIGAWVIQQKPAAPDMSVGDLYYHAVQKVAAMGDLDLVPKPVIAQTLSVLAPAILPHVPEEDRELLRQNIDRLCAATKAGPAAGPAVGTLIRQQADKPKESAAAPLTQAAAQGLKRLSMFLQRLRPLAAAGPAAPAPAPGGALPAGTAAVPTGPPPMVAFDPRNEATSQFITTAAAQAHSAKELEQHLAPLREFGIETAMEKIVKALAASLPGWGTLPQMEGAAPTLAGLQLNAMRQIVSLAESPEDAAKRFRELVHAAIEQFNEGNLGRASTMFELAEKLVVEAKVKPAFVDPVRRTNHEHLDAERLRKAGERPDQRTDLRRILNFFEALRPEGLLKTLDGEPRRDRRHQLLAMLEAHGEPARARAFEALKASVEPGAKADPFFQMNLVYLLRVIPRPAGASIEDEVNVVTRAPGRESPPPLVKQVIAYLATIRHEKAERALITYLHVFENMLLQPQGAVYPHEDVETLLDRVCAALARYGTPRAWKSLVDHGLKTEPRLGLSMSRIVEAGRQDLSSSPDLVERLIVALRAELPKSVLGFKVKKNDDRILWLIQALGGTPLPQVSEVLKEVSEQHKGEKFAEAAGKALAGLTAAKTETSAGLSGDLELFGLPGLLQTLGQSSLTGVLSMMRTPGKVEASILLEGGRYRGAQFGELTGVDAIYEMFERPFPGTFAFVPRTEISGQGGLADPQDLLGLLLEGVRRHDEFKRAAVMVPDRAPLKAGGVKPTALPDEQAEFTRRVWTKVSPGATALECETAMKVDAYRVRRLLAHWVEQGSLELSAAA